MCASSKQIHRWQISILKYMHLRRHWELPRQTARILIISNLREPENLKTLTPNADNHVKPQQWGRQEKLHFGTSLYNSCRWTSLPSLRGLFSYFRENFPILSKWPTHPCLGNVLSFSLLEDSLFLSIFSSFLLSLSPSLPSSSIPPYISLSKLLQDCFASLKNSNNKI